MHEEHARAGIVADKPASVAVECGLTIAAGRPRREAEHDFDELEAVRREDGSVGSLLEVRAVAHAVGDAIDSGDKLGVCERFLPFLERDLVGCPVSGRSNAVGDNTGRTSQAAGSSAGEPEQLERVVPQQLPLGPEQVAPVRQPLE